MFRLTILAGGLVLSAYRRIRSAIVAGIGLAAMSGLTRQRSEAITDGG